MLSIESDPNSLAEDSGGKIKADCCPAHRRPRAHAQQEDRAQGTTYQPPLKCNLSYLPLQTAGNQTEVGIPSVYLLMNSQHL